MKNDSEAKVQSKHHNGPIQCTWFIEPKYRMCNVHSEHVYSHAYILVFVFILCLFVIDTFGMWSGVTCYSKQIVLAKWYFGHLLHIRCNRISEFFSLSLRFIFYFDLKSSYFYFYFLKIYITSPVIQWNVPCVTVSLITKWMGNQSVSFYLFEQKIIRFFSQQQTPKIYCLPSFEILSMYNRKKERKDQRRNSQLI